jgi:hypothetical protein
MVQDQRKTQKLPQKVSDGKRSQSIIHVHCRLCILYSQSCPVVIVLDDFFDTQFGSSSGQVHDVFFYLGAMADFNSSKTFSVVCIAPVV